MSGHPRSDSGRDGIARGFDVADELRWLHELIASPLWGELSGPQRRRWLHQLHLLKALQYRY